MIFWCIMISNHVDVLIYQFVLREKTEIIKICFDTENKVYSYWMYVEEISDPDRRWAQIRKKDFRKQFNTYTKLLIDIYGSLDNEQEDDEGYQIAFQL